jgi:hypothetical protein
MECQYFIKQMDVPFEEGYYHFYGCTKTGQAVVSNQVIFKLPVPGWCPEKQN